MSTRYGRMRIAAQNRRLIAGFYRFQRVGFSIVVLGFSASLAAAEPAKRVFNIEAKPATQSLIDYARQAHTQLGYDVDIVDAILTNAVVGEYDPAEALELLLKDTGLKAEYGERGIFIRRVATREVGGDIKERTLPVAETNSLRLAQALAPEARGTMVQNQTSRRTEADIGEAGNKRPLEEIIVTGTNIRGIAPESSPIQTYTREDIQISGAGTVQEFLQTLTMNFAGGAAESGSAPGNDQAGSNSSRGTGVNLRGLGSGSTLVLVNGRRVAPSSDIGGFVDIAMIPASAIERVDVLTDGASSIYGGDAVAGVINFILRKDYDGVEASLRYGTVTEGGMDAYRVSTMGGKDWGSGNGLIVYEYYKRDNLDSSERAFSDDALSPNDLLPTQLRHSVIGTATQHLAPNLELSTDILHSRRESLDTNTILSGASVGTSVSLDSNSTNSNFGATLTWNFTDDWYFDIAGTYSETSTRLQRFTSGNLDRNLRTDSDLWSIEAKASGSIIDLPAGPLKLAVGGQFRQARFFHNEEVTSSTRDGDRDVYAVFGEAVIPIIGPENTLTGVRRLEINVSGRYEDYSDFGNEANPKVGLLWAPADGLRFRGTYGTSFKPPTVGQTGALDRLALASPTSFLFSALGVTPADASIADVVVLYVQGTSADLEAETSRAFTGGFDYDESNGRHNFSLSSTYFDIIFENRLSQTPVPNNQNDLVAFNIGFDSPNLFPEGTFTFFPTPDELNDAIATLDVPAISFLGADPLDAEIIDFVNMVRNLSRTVVRGLDFDVAYSFDSDFGQLILGMDGTYLTDFSQQGALTTPVVQLLNTQFNPLRINLRGRAGYTRDGLSVNLFVNYSDNYNTDNTDTAAPISSWTTVDGSFSHDWGDRPGNPLRNNLVVRLSVRNLFNEDPPAALSLPSIGLLGYDPTNASPIGRFISFEVTKRF